MIEKEKLIYQRTNLDIVKKINVISLKKKILLENYNDKIKFVVIGELMCNNIYDYEKRDIYGKFFLIGAVIGPENNIIGKKIMNDLLKNGFACTNPYMKKLEDNEIGKINLIMNEKLMDLFKKNGYDVPLIFGKGKLKDVIFKNYEWMVNGCGEGFVLSLENFNKDGFSLLKWKIGLEPQNTNLKIFQEFKKKKIWHEIGKSNDEKDLIFEMINKMHDISKSKNNFFKLEKSKNQNNFSKLENFKQYKEAIDSAKTKFDYSHTFFTNFENFIKYVNYISNECKNDIEVKNDQEHFEKVKSFIQIEYFEYLNQNN